MWLLGATVAVAVLFLFTGCRSVRYVPVETVRTDSLYLTKVERDSIHVMDSVTVMVKGDTVWRDRWRIEYRDRLRTDTTYIERCDTVQVPLPVEAQLTKWQQARVTLGEVLLALLAIGVLVAVGIIAKKKIFGASD